MKFQYILLMSVRWLFFLSANKITTPIFYPKNCGFEIFLIIETIIEKIISADDNGINRLKLN